MKSFIKKISIGIGVLACSFSLLSTPVTTFPAQAATGGPSAEQQKDILRWIYKTENGKVYKRLYNASTGNWAGEWIYVRDL